MNVDDKKLPRLTILMPCLNEAQTLSACIKKAGHWIERSGIDTEILIADNGSTDGSQQMAIENGAKVIQVIQRGYGAALYHGAKAALGEYIIMGDSDDSYDFSQLDLFFSKLTEGFDLVMGNRFLGGIEKGAMPWKNRFIGNPILSWIGRKLFKCPANDFHCGLRGFRKDAFERMDLRTTGMEFASEMVIKANLLGMRIAEVPTTLSKDGRSRPPHLRPWRDGWRHLRFMMLFSPRCLFLVPGTSIFCVCLFFYLWLTLGTIGIGAVVFDIHTLFYMQAGMTIGFLAACLGVIVSMIGMREGLLQKNWLLERLRTSPILEFGGILGVFMLAVGFYLGFNLLIKWQASGFGELVYSSLLREVSFSTSMITFGGILFFVSLVMGFLALPTKQA